MTETSEWREVLAECADCLESEVEARWRLPDGTIHPAQQRKYERDLEPVKKARALLAALPSCDGWRGIESAQKPDCGCRMCLRDVKDERGYPVLMSRFVVCPSCGNKRCPAASDHRFACTGSNKSGQFGSVFGPEIAVRDPLPARKVET